MLGRREHARGDLLSRRRADAPSDRRLRSRALFVHGSRDPFGSLPELRAALALVPAPTRLLAIEGGTHALAGGRGAPTVDVAAECVAAFLALVGAPE